MSHARELDRLRAVAEALREARAIGRWIADHQNRAAPLGNWREKLLRLDALHDGALRVLGDALEVLEDARCVKIDARLDPNADEEDWA